MATRREGKDSNLRIDADTRDRLKAMAAENKTTMAGLLRQATNGVISLAPKSKDARP